MYSHGPSVSELVVSKFYMGVLVAASRSVCDEVLAQRQHSAGVQRVPVCPLEDGERDAAERVYGQQ